MVTSCAKEGEARGWEAVAESATANTGSGELDSRATVSEAVAIEATAIEGTEGESVVSAGADASEVAFDAGAALAFEEGLRAAPATPTAAFDDRFVVFSIT